MATPHTLNVIYLGSSPNDGLLPCRTIGSSSHSDCENFGSYPNGGSKEIQMKKLIILLSLISLPASAEINTLNLKVALGLLPVSFFHEIVAHETAHLVMAKSTLSGFELTKFAPYPSTKDGKFYLGYVSWNYTGEYQEDTYLLITLAPYILNTSAFIISDMLLSTKVVKVKSVAGVTLFMFGMFAPYLNYAINLINGGDWRDVRQSSKPYINVIGGVLLAVGTYRLVSQGYNVFTR